MASPSNPPSPTTNRSPPPSPVAPTNTSVELFVDTKASPVSMSLPGAQDNAIDADNPGDLKSVGAMVGLARGPNWSLRQKGFSPNMGEYTPKVRPNMAEPDFIEDDDEDFDPSADLKRKRGKAKSSGSGSSSGKPMSQKRKYECGLTVYSSESAEEDSDEEDVEAYQVVSRRSQSVEVEELKEAEDIIESVNQDLGDAFPIVTPEDLQARRMAFSQLSPDRDAPDVTASQIPSPHANSPQARSSPGNWYSGVHSGTDEIEEGTEDEHIPLQALLDLQKGKGKMRQAKVKAASSISAQASDIGSDDDEAEDDTFKLGRDELETEKRDAAADVITSRPSPRRSLRLSGPSKADMPKPRHTPSPKSTPRKVSSLSPENFMSKSVKERFEFFRKKGFLVERVIDHTFEDVGMKRYLEEKGLLFSVSYPNNYYPSLVSEFYAGLVQAIQDPRDVGFEKVKVRGTLINFSPALINIFLHAPSPHILPPMAHKDEIANTITNGLDPSWHSQFKCTMLTSLCSFLFKISTFNWKPSSNKNIVTVPHADLIHRIFTGQVFNLGEVIFGSIVQFAEKELPSDLPFPCLITGLCVRQGVEILRSDRICEKIEPFGIQPVLECTRRTVDLPVAFPDDPVIDAQDGDEDEHADASEDEPTSPLSQDDQVQMVTDEIKFLEKTMLLYRVQFKEMATRRNKMLAYRERLSGQKGGASSSNIYRDISSDFRWELLAKTQAEVEGRQGQGWDRGVNDD